MARDVSVPVFDHSDQPNAGRMPTWVRQSLGQGLDYSRTARTVHDHHLHTVCKEARCPNRGECWSSGTATFMLLGDTCTRACGFCSVKTGRPDPAAMDEPRRVADAIASMGLGYVVLTSVNRDDLPDGGAGIFAETLRILRKEQPELGLEVLTPDFRDCQEQAIEQLTSVLAGGRLVWGHNMETVPSLYCTVRKGAKYERSLRLLQLAAEQRGIETKSALMLGLGEQFDEVIDVLRDLRQAGVERIALGQYLRPTRYHLPVKEYVTPERFDAYGQEAKALGFSWVQSGPMVRSSYHAEQ